MSDEYDLVARGKLKLKTDSISSKDKKKKKKEKKRERERLERGVRQEQETIDEEVRANAAPKGATMTKAEMSFKKMQQKMQDKRISEKASMTHKQKVEKFNEHLDSLTEHFDIPKVSWTK